MLLDALDKHDVGDDVRRSFDAALAAAATGTASREEWPDLEDEIP